MRPAKAVSDSFGSSEHNQLPKATRHHGYCSVILLVLVEMIETLTQLSDEMNGGREPTRILVGDTVVSLQKQRVHSTVALAACLNVAVCNP